MVEAPVPAGEHNVTLWLVPQQSLWAAIPFAPASYEALLDHIMLVKGLYITITGLKPGAQVYIYDADTGQLVYSGVAASTTIRIPAWTIGYQRFPLHAKIVVTLPP